MFPQDSLPPAGVVSPAAQCDAARRVLGRLGLGLPKITLHIDVPTDDVVSDWFELEARDGQLCITASSGVALCRSAYHYIRQTGAGMVAWSGSNVRLPDPLPDFPKTRVQCPYQFRHYMNVVTFGYSTAYWDWERWEQEIDWMALHGINMPLAHVGQETIWRRVWRHYGLSDDEINTHFTGPGYLPWNRMGNISRHDGPPPEAWHQRQSMLQRQILERMRELGMKPVAPAFAGIVPAALRDKLGPSEVHALEPWAGFEEKCRTYLLSPFSKLFPDIGKRFIHEYAREYGRCQYYLADSLMELELPELEKDPEEFAAALGKITARSIHEADPDGVWLMQGWIFHFSPRIWTRKAAKAFLDSVPNERVIIIDLCNELYPGWQKLKGFFGKSWIYGVVHNFGGNNPVNGDMRFYSRDLARALASSRRGNLVGFSICPEGIENNEVVYELLTDVAWSDKPVPLAAWLKNYCRSRYGAYPAAMQKSWRLLLPSVYHRFHITVRHGFQRRPTLRPVGRVDIKPEAREALELFLLCAPKLGAGSFYQQDAAELVVHYLGTQVDVRLRDAGRAHEAGMADFRNQCIEDALDMLIRMDALMGVNPTARLDRWIGFATRSGATPEDSRYYAQNARRLITTWGGPALSEYASKVWNGLIRDYYVERWRVFHEALRCGEEVDLAQWEENWIVSDENPSPDLVVQDPIAEAWSLLDRVDQWERRDFQIDDRGDRIGRWSTDQPAAEWVSLEWNVSQYLLEPGSFEVVFKSDSIPAGAVFEIKHVRLVENGVEVARDGRTGQLKAGRLSYEAELKLITRKPGTDYVITAKMRAPEAPNSAGTVWLKSMMPQ